VGSMDGSKFSEREVMGSVPSTAARWMRESHCRRGQDCSDAY
jgi:hypothetical protein